MREEGKEEPFHEPFTAQGAQFQASRTTTCPIDALVEHQPIDTTERIAELTTLLSYYYYIIVSGVADNIFFYYISFLCPPTIVSEHTCTDIIFILSHVIISSSRTSRATRGSCSAS